MKKITMKPVDMTIGTPWKQMLAFMIPMLIGNIAQQLYNTVDSIVVGHYLGDNALAAVGNAGPIINLLIVLFIGIGVGAGILVSQYVGAGDKEGTGYTVGNCVLLIVAASVIVTLAGIFLSGPLLRLLQTPQSLIDWCTIYLRIMFAGSIGLGIYNILCGVLRGMGDSVSALIYLIIASLINIVLDIFFVAVLGMGVEGVAWATIIAQGISAVLCVRKLSKMKEFMVFDRKCIRWKREYGMVIIRLGVPSGITQMIFSMSSIVVQSLVNSFGEQFIAACVIVTRIDGFAMQPAMTFGNAMTTYAGQNTGANKEDRVRQGTRQGILISCAVSAVIAGLLFIFGRFAISFFTATPEIIDQSTHLLRLLTPGYVAMAATHCLAGVMRGCGNTITPMWLAIIQLCVMRVPFSYLLCYLTRSAEFPNGRSEMIYVGLLMAFLLGCLMHVLVFISGRWRKRIVKRT